MRWLTEGPHEGETLGEVVSDAGLLRRPSRTRPSAALAEQMVERDVGRVPIVDRGRPRWSAWSPARTCCGSTRRSARWRSTA